MITDTDRLEFFFGNKDTQGYYLAMGEGDFWRVWDQSNGLQSIGEGTTMREAMDAAMEYKAGEWNE